MKADFVPVKWLENSAAGFAFDGLQSMCQAFQTSMPASDASRAVLSYDFLAPRLAARHSARLLKAA